MTEDKKMITTIIICFGLLPFIGGWLMGYYFLDLPLWGLFLYALFHSVGFIGIMLLAMWSGEREWRKVKKELNIR